MITSASAAEATAGIAMNSAKALTIIVFIAIYPSANHPFAGITASIPLVPGGVFGSRDAISDGCSRATRHVERGSFDTMSCWQDALSKPPRGVAQLNKAVLRTTLYVVAFDRLICGVKHLSCEEDPRPFRISEKTTKQAASDSVRKCKVSHRSQDQQNRHRDKHGDCQALCSPDKVSDLVVVSPRYKIKDRRNFRRTVVVVCGSGGCAFTHGSLDKGHY